MSEATQDKKFGFKEIRENYLKPGVRESVMSGVQNSGADLHNPLIRHIAKRAAFNAALGMQEKVEETQKLTSEARKQANTDSLTGLPNRRAFDENVDTIIASGKPCGFLIIDLDKFKRVNDLYGHPVGDEVLRKIANNIVLSLAGEITSSVRSKDNKDRPEDTIYRWGGEEFVALLHGVKNLTTLKTIAERIRKAVSNNPHMIKLGEQEIEELLTVSIGGALFESGNLEDFDICIRNADKNLYSAKHNGRDKSVVR
jgi:diguanylate cyclase (GGDEF)-like protein